MLTTPSETRMMSNSHSNNTTSTTASSSITTITSTVNNLPLTHATNTTTSTLSTTSPTTLLSLPPELRLKIYTHILQPSSSLSTNLNGTQPSLRPQRKIGWNRPHATLTNPSLLFDSDSPPALKALFQNKLTKGDHALILECVLRIYRVLIAEHVDLLALLKIASSTTSASAAAAPSAKGNGRCRGKPAPTPPNLTRSLNQVIRHSLRTIDFSDRMDEIVCQPNDLIKLVVGLPGLRSIYLASRHVQRYSGTIEEHVEFAKEREEGVVSTMHGNTGVQSQLQSQTQTQTHGASVTEATAAAIANELRRLTLRSPMTDGTRLMISPGLFSTDILQTTNKRPTRSANPSPAWVIVDLSMLIWQHFLYVGPPYRDHWRPHKVEKLLDVADKKNVDVILGLRNVEFDPSLITSEDGSRGRNGVRMRRLQAGGGAVFKGEMSTRDWILRLRGVRGAGGGEYCVKQRKGIT